MDTVLASFGGVNSPARITLTTYENVRMVDIRKFYKDRKTAELKPTTKGISLTQSSFNEMLDCLNDNWPKISNWLTEAGGEASTDEGLQRQAKKNSIKIPTEIKISYVKTKSTLAYRVDSEGGAAKLDFNENHPFVKAFTEKKTYTKPEVEYFISQILVALHVARFQSEIDGSEDGNMVDYNAMTHICSRLLETSFKG